MAHALPVIALLASAAFLVATPAAAEPEAPRTAVRWERSGYGEAVRVTARKAGPELERAQEEVQAIADRLDALRTVEPHVVWTLVAWEDGRVRVRARAASGLYGNVAIRAVRQLYPERSTAGSGVRQLRTEDGRFDWRVKILIHRAPVPKQRGEERPQSPVPRSR